MRGARAILAACFVVTGATALLVEQVFEKLLSTVVGASTPAGAIVLSVYFTGLGAGAVFFASIAARSPRPVRLYGLLEGFAGAWALAMALAFSRIQTASSLLVQAAGTGALAVFLARIAVAGLWILPIAAASGGSFPAIVAALGRSAPGDRPRHAAISRFYSWNLLGATAGAAGSMYLLFPRYGMTGSLAIVALVQGAVVIAAFGIDTRLGGAPASAAMPAPACSGAQPGGIGILLGIAGLSGVVFFSYEVLWIHLVGAVLGTSVYAFGIMLAMVLAGLFAGGIAASTLFARGGQVGAGVLGLALALASAALLLAFGMWDDVPGILLRRGASLDVRRGRAAPVHARRPARRASRALPRRDLPSGLPAPMVSDRARRARGGLARRGQRGGIGARRACHGFPADPGDRIEAAYRGLCFLLLLALTATSIELWRRRDRTAGGTPFGAGAGVLAAIALAWRASTLPPWDPLL
ncbi:MAG: hypothetical protein U0166_04380 [Acidobacteriota bacterium]